MTIDDAPSRVLIYGAYGYTGTLVVAESVRRGIRPVLAGRSPQPLAALAARHGLAHRAVALDDAAGLRSALADIDVVAHCAGPYGRTSAPMVQACLDTATQYLDLTGEAEVFDAVYARHDDALAAGVALVPGVGFDVVPTDHLIAALAPQLPEAVRADVAVVSRGGFSRGTLITALLGVARGNRIRRGQGCVTVPLCHRRLTVELPRGKSVTVASTPLGDLASGPRAVDGLTEVTTFTPVPGAAAIRAMDRPLRALLGSPRIVGGVERLLRTLPGPSERAMARTRSAAWARLYDEHGAYVTLAVEVPNTYAFTAASMVHAVMRLPARQADGALAPSTVFGADFLHTIPDIEVSFRRFEPAAV